MKFYRLISKAWNKVLITLLQRARNIQTIIDALVFNHSRTDSTRPDARRVPATIPPPCGRNLVQTILHWKVPRTPIVAPTRQMPCDHVRCNLYAAAHMNRGTIKGGSLFCPVYLIFNYPVQHIKHIERALTSCPRLRVSLSKWTFLPDRDLAIITTATLLNILRTQTSQNIAPLLRTLRAQHSHLYRTNRPNSDPDRYNPQFPLTHALHNIASTLNIPSSQHLLAKPLPTVTQQYKRYRRAATICPYPPRSDTSQKPRMCDQCILLRSQKLRYSPILANHNPCGACNLPSNTIPTPQPYPACVVYALLY